jgi:hypothetical protein
LNSQHQRLKKNEEPKKDIKKVSTFQNVRINVNFEEEVKVPQIVIKPKYVKIHKRKSFSLRSKEGQLMWKFDFILSWSGNTKQQVETKVLTIAPRVAIECECMMPELYSTEIFNDVFFVFLSLLLKVQDLIFYSMIGTLKSNIDPFPCGDCQGFVNVH